MTRIAFDVPDWAARAAWTWAQTFAAAEVAAGASWLHWATIKVGALAAGAAGFSVAKSGALVWWRARRAERTAKRVAAAFETQQPAETPS